MSAIHTFFGRPGGRTISVRIQPLALSIFLALFSVFHATETLAGGVGSLDAESRRAVREAQMGRYGGRAQGGSVEYRDRSGVAVQNDVRGRRTNCTTQVGQVNNNEVRHGNRIQQVTVVEGNVVNVCD